MFGYHRCKYRHLIIRDTHRSRTIFSLVITSKGQIQTCRKCFFYALLHSLNFSVPLWILHWKKHWIHWYKNFNKKFEKKLKKIVIFQGNAGNSFSKRQFRRTVTVLDGNCPVSSAENDRYQLSRQDASVSHTRRSPLGRLFIPF